MFGLTEYDWLVLLNSVVLFVWTLNALRNTRAIRQLSGQLEQLQIQLGASQLHLFAMHSHMHKFDHKQQLLSMLMADILSELESDGEEEEDEEEEERPAAEADAPAYDQVADGTYGEPGPYGTGSLLH